MAPPSAPGGGCCWGAGCGMPGCGWIMPGCWPGPEPACLPWWPAICCCCRE